MSETSDRTVTHAKAREILGRFNNSHWGNSGEKAHYSIPARPEQDDDLLLARYIDENERELAAAIRERDASHAREAGLWEALDDLQDYTCSGGASDEEHMAMMEKVNAALKGEHPPVVPLDVAEGLAGALEELSEWQNGPPLLTEKWLNGWNGAMEKSEQALAAYRANRGS